MIVFNPSGTHRDSDGYIKIRLDIYPSEGMETYNSHHVWVPAEDVPLNLTDKQFQEWLKNVKKIEQYNPMLCHFVVLPGDTTQDRLRQFILDVFTPQFLADIDGNLAQVDGVHRISPLMRSKGILEKRKTLESDISDINNRFNNLIIRDKEEFFLPKIIKPESISVGAAAIVRGGTTGGGITVVTNEHAPCDGAGIIDTINLYVSLNTANFRVGLASVESNKVTILDGSWVNLGTVPAGSMQTFSGLTLVANIGEYLAFNLVTGALYRDTSGGVGYWWNLNDDLFPCISVLFTHVTASPNVYSLNGIGTEVGGVMPGLPIQNILALIG